MRFDLKQRNEILTNKRKRKSCLVLKELSIHLLSQLRLRKVVKKEIPLSCLVVLF